MACFLVTGGAGFIGSHLVRALLGEGHTVRVLDDLSSGNRENVPQEVELTEADVTDPAAVARALVGVDGCFHLAAIASVDRSHREWLRTHQVNLTGTINVFDQARPSRCHRESRCLRLDGGDLWELR
jgi:UDP-glucose 4-epimerase